MPDIHVSCALAEELQICRYVSFVDFVDLLKFGQIRLEKERRDENLCPIRKVSASQGMNRYSPEYSEPVSIESIEPLLWQDRMSLKQQRDSFLLQSWRLTNEAEPHCWKCCPHTEQCVAIVSNVGALAESILVPDDTNLTIEATEHARQHSRTPTPPYRVSVFAHTSRTSQPSSSKSRIRFHVILSSLISEVVVAPNAPNRFLELVTKLVREHTLATVTRANQFRLEPFGIALGRAD